MKIPLKRIGTFVLALTLSVFLGAAVPMLAQTSASNPRDALTAEIRSLAQSDVEDDIPRRTDFVIKLYSNNATKITPPEIRKIYEEEYVRQLKEKFPQKLLKHPAIPFILFVLGLIVGLLLRRANPFQVKKVTVNLPFGISGELEVDLTERKAAWSLYVELITRVATQQLGTEQGLLREALNSLYSFFATTRQILREAGAGIDTSEKSVGGIAIDILNKGIRPFLSKWHPALEEWEAQRPSDRSRKEHEKLWTEEANMRQNLEDIRKKLVDSAKELAKIARA